MPKMHDPTVTERCPHAGYQQGLSTGPIARLGRARAHQLPSSAVCVGAWRQRILSRADQRGCAKVLLGLGLGPHSRIVVRPPADNKICAGTAHICAGTAHICAGTAHICPHLRRDCPHLPTSAPGLHCLHMPTLSRDCRHNVPVLVCQVLAPNQLSHIRERVAVERAVTRQQCLARGIQLCQLGPDERAHLCACDRACVRACVQLCLT